MSLRWFAMCAGPVLPLCVLVLVAVAEAPADPPLSVTTADVEEMMTSLSNWGRWENTTS
jgi:hypothetical protein